MKKIVWLLFIFIVSGEISIAQPAKITPVKLEAYKRIDNPARDEVSGIVKSRKYEDTYWIHGDSGTNDRIYAINAQGELKSKDHNGVRIKGVKNEDWEDIALGEKGTLIIADIGNNCFCREDLSILVIAEPNPEDEEVEVIEKYRIKYPEQSGLLSLFVEENHNAEAIFVKSGEIYIITKNPSGESYLFKLQNPVLGEINTLKEVSSFKFRGLVTAADISEDQSKLAVLTYNGIWLFDLIDAKGMFEGNSYWQPIKGVEQVESISFSGENLIIAEENGDLYQIKIAEIPAYKLRN